jgi:bacterioferritin (cytochrome b1)
VLPSLRDHQLFVDPLIDKVNAILVQLNEALGINLAGADAYAAEYAMCNSPRLRG